MASKRSMIKTLSQQKLLHNNAALSSIFHRMADCYRYLGNKERFRAIAYENVAKMLHNMNEDIANYATDIKSLDEIKGIGESIAEKIIEYLHTGKIRTFEQLKKQVPYELLELMDITGFGPATLKTLHEELLISKKEDLIKALETGRLNNLKGFGEKKIENMRRALKLFKEKDCR
jgi:DNA polymerase (family X)